MNEHEVYMAFVLKDNGEETVAIPARFVVGSREQATIWLMSLCEVKSVEFARVKSVAYFTAYYKLFGNNALLIDPAAPDDDGTLVLKFDDGTLTTKVGT